MLLLLTAILCACQKPAVVPESVDGLYFADSHSGYRLGPPRLLLLEQGLFELLDGEELLQRGTFEMHDGVLRLKPVGTGSRVVLESTYAVVDGHLLLGVLRPVNGEQHRWISSALPWEFLAEAGMLRPQPAAFRIDWDMREGQWRFSSGARQVVLSGVARLENPADGGRSFVPVFRRPDRRGGVDDPTGMVAEGPVAVGLSFRFGWEAGPEDPLEWDGALVRPRSSDAGPGMAPADVFREQFQSDGGASTYRRRGDIVMTPWTVDLGPVGLLPVHVDPWTREGTYVSGDKELVVSARPPPQDGTYAAAFRREGDESTCHYLPDARGLAVWSLGMEHEPMNHADKTTVMFCFALADGRFVRYVSSGGCNGGRPASLDVFQHRVGP
ncbi:hypothetical protein JY651_10875 [Pyxidicoccus parkwayensis]|uniref:Lipoprotein n=1 Tax=Pyxidicoccus parkwayensis TaxID=2813578 RepID=A0ABX7P4M6_9BACT|nr:hypothetical protein [Pyxidicoccus parkwaysis]QSQ25391.1 hypothetical protein JY651_10875 [Pyxidicoccus parkwaysis]